MPHVLYSLLRMDQVCTLMLLCVMYNLIVETKSKKSKIQAQSVCHSAFSLIIKLRVWSRPKQSSWCLGHDLKLDFDTVSFLATHHRHCHNHSHEAIAWQSFLNTWRKMNNQSQPLQQPCILVPCSPDRPKHKSQWNQKHRHSQCAYSIIIKLVVWSRPKKRG